ncbi:hypothetical protein ACFOZY_14135 [Chungangia koreensis]|uniref:Uncharacterized protein n=1 Tax=Chungangia koreensis TaxID=752657 RepID=A0ABV8XAZ2_9LACT
MTNSMEQNVVQYLAEYDEGLTDQDSQMAYEMCARALTDYYKAVWNGSDIELYTFIESDNLKQYMQKKIQSQYDLHANSNDPVQNVEVVDWEVEFADEEEGNYLYLLLPAHVHKNGGGFGEPTEFLVQNKNRKLVIVDWYMGAKDSYDFFVRGENLKINNPAIWDDREFVKRIKQKQREFSGSTR